MISLDEDALICDLAETYHIFDYKQLPVSQVAVFSCGLRNDSRIKLKLIDEQVPLETILLASVSDKLSNLVWMNSVDAQKGKNKPTSLVEILNGKQKPSSDKESVAFNSGEDFERARQEALGGE